MNKRILSGRNSPVLWKWGTDIAKRQSIRLYSGTTRL